MNEFDLKISEMIEKVEYYYKVSILEEYSNKIDFDMKKND